MPDPDQLPDEAINADGELNVLYAAMQDCLRAVRAAAAVGNGAGAKDFAQAYATLHSASLP